MKKYAVDSEVKFTIKSIFTALSLHIDHPPALELNQIPKIRTNLIPSPGRLLCRSQI